MIGPVAQSIKADKLTQPNTHHQASNAGNVSGLKANYKSKNEDLKSKEPAFDYLKYIEQSEQ